jgi:hypothetical protein
LPDWERAGERADPDRRGAGALATIEYHDVRESELVVKEASPNSKRLICPCPGRGPYLTASFVKLRAKLEDSQLDGTGDASNRCRA